MSKKALLIIDIQNGFCPGGNLAVPDGDRVVPIVNTLIERGGYDLIVASQDWHPAGHGSFASQHPGRQPFEMGLLGGKPQMLWPDHCVQGTTDAAFHPDLNASRIDFVQRKGTDPAVDSYSAFRDNAKSALTGLDTYLKKAGITELHIAGLATDYCVRFSALDAKNMLPGVEIVLIEDASRGIDPRGVQDALTEMQAAGIHIRQSRDLLASAPRSATPSRTPPRP